MPDSYVVARAHSNVASVYQARADYATAERMYREALALYQERVPPDHPLVAEVMISLGHTLIAQRRFAEAEPYTRGGYEILCRAHSETKFLTQGRTDLIAIYEGLGEPARAVPYRAASLCK